MTKCIKADFSQLRELQKNLQHYEKLDINRFCQDCANELAAKLLEKVIKRTPVGQYGDVKVGGTLRRGWTTGNVIKKGNVFEIEIINPTEYASYVEFGHKTADYKGWIEGRFMLTITEKEIENMAPTLLEEKLMQMLKECFD